jgi:hypothetical protein
MCCGLTWVSTGQLGIASGHAATPITVSVHGTVLTGALIAERAFFSELVSGNPLMSALEPSSGLLGKEYAKETEAASDHHLHLRGVGRGDGKADGLWRLSLETIEGWTLRAATGAEADKGPSARLLGTP